MKKRVLWFSILTGLTLSVCGQEIDTTYFINECLIGSKNKYNFYRLSVKWNDTIMVTDYRKNGNIRMTGAFKEKEFINPIGIFTYYDKNNNVTSLVVNQAQKYPELTSKYLPVPDSVNFNTDSLVLIVGFNKNKKIKCYGYELPAFNRIGTWVFMEKRGHVKIIESYRNNTLHGPIFYYYDGKLSVSGNYSYGKQSGEWIVFNLSDGSVLDKKVYKEGRKVK
jgi:antitoxin component YwqK of YwqJK toxin-antitoxin module